MQLTEKGRGLEIRIQDQYHDVEAAVDGILKECNHNLWEALGEFEYALEQKNLMKRIMEQKKARESKKITIVDYQAKYRADFKRINEQWISQYFTMEASDYKALDHPDTYILNPGGAIVVALLEGKAVGVCALIKMDHKDYDFELAKMGVAPEARGMGVGSLLGQAIIDKARTLGAKNLYLESNTVLEPAIKLYQKLGFKKIVGIPSPYARCNIQMDLNL